MLAGVGRRERVWETEKKSGGRLCARVRAHTLARRRDPFFFSFFFLCAHVHVRRAIVSGWGHQSC